MRVASKLVGLMLIALAPSARATGAGAPNTAPAPAPVVVDAATPAPPVPDASERRVDVNLAFLPMGAGKYTTPLSSTMDVTSDAAFAYGVSLSGNFRIIRGFSVGLAPQIIWNVMPKVNPTQLMASGADKEVDLMLRLAYTQPLGEGISVYGELLPGYSLLMPPAGKVPKGIVLALGAGVKMDLTSRFYANIGLGYQMGFQSLTVTGETANNHVRYLRVALGGGVRF